MLTHLLFRLPVSAGHWLQRWLGVFEGMHDFLEGFCPCDAFDLDDEDFEQTFAA